MWSPTAVLPSAPPWGGQPSHESPGQAGMKAPRLQTRYNSSLIGMHLDPAGTPKASDQRFCWSGAISVGLGGLEPPASSLSEIDGCAPC